MNGQEGSQRSTAWTSEMRAMKENHITPSCDPGENSRRGYVRIGLAIPARHPHGIPARSDRGGNGSLSRLVG
jgi:hypothetical protein